MASWVLNWRYQPNALIHLIFSRTKSGLYRIGPLKRPCVDQPDLPRSAFLDSDLSANSSIGSDDVRRPHPKASPDGAKNGLSGADLAKRIPQGLKPA